MFAQHRKWGLDMYIIAQHEDRVDIALRELIAAYYRVNRIGRFARAAVHFEKRDRSNKAGGIYFYLSDWHYNAYWSNLVIGGRDGKGYELGTSAELERLGIATYYRLDIPGESVAFVDESDLNLLRILEAAKALGAKCQKVHRHPRYGFIPAIILPKPSSSRRPGHSVMVEEAVRQIYDLHTS